MQLVFALLCAVAAGVLCSAQTTTISGTVFDPRTTSDSLPLPNVLVYATTAAVPALPAGVQCLQPAAPAGATSYTNTAVDGSFTLSNIPVNASYTLVIQSGKWRRQFPQAVAAAPITGLSLHMPSDHTQGDIPMIAISTGSVDGVECVLRDMGIADTEFTDDNGTVNPGGHIHLYQGGGAFITLTSPPETALTQNAATLNGYDMVMFPCNGGPVVKSTSALTNMLNFANAGGRIFATHYSYDWLDPQTPYDAPFSGVANWDPQQPGYDQDSLAAVVNTAFTDGATLAQWLQNAGAILPNTNPPDQIEVTTLRRDLDSIIPPTQSWLSIPSTTSAPDWVLQLTFNTPVGAAAANQCGRVLFNEYHVVNLPQESVQFPTECGTATPMSAQEEMLEYALFDLSAFEQPVVVPTLTLGFDPSPLPVKPGDTGDQVTITATNTSTTSVIDSAAVLTVTLPPLLTATAIADATGGWQCTLGSLTCTRSTSLAPKATDSITLTLSVAPYPAGGPPSGGGSITATVTDPSFSNNVTASDSVIYRQPPALSWATPSPIVYGTALGSAQLDATSPVAGSFAYNPAAGTVLPVGQHTLAVTFTPTDQSIYINATASVTLTVVAAVPAVGLTAAPNPAFIQNPVTFTATLSSPATTPTGTVAFYDGATQIGASGLNSGSGSISASSLALGPHAITAAYSGDANYQASTSAAVSVTLEDFSIALANGASGSATVYPGHAATYAVTVSPIGGPTLPQEIDFKVEGLPAGATASFSPASIPANAPTTTVTVSITPSSLSARQTTHLPLGQGALPVVLGCILLPWARGARKRWMRLLLIACSALFLSVGMNACGGVTYTPHSSTLTVTANSGALAHSTGIQLTVE